MSVPTSRAPTRLRPLRSYLLNAVIAGIGGFAVFVLVFTVTRFSSAYYVWSLFNFLILFVALGVCLGTLVGFAAWGSWVAAKRLGRGDVLLPTPSGAVAGLGLAWAVWRLFPFEGPMLVVVIASAVIFGASCSLTASRLARMEPASGDRVIDAGVGGRR